MVKSKRGEPAGNSIAAQAQLDRMLVRQATALHRLEGVFDRWFDEGIDSVSFTVRAPRDDNPDYLLVARASKEGDRIVSFHNAPTVIEVVVGFAERAQNGSLVWREDKYGK